MKEPKFTLEEISKAMGLYGLIQVVLWIEHDPKKRAKVIKKITKQTDPKTRVIIALANDWVEAHLETLLNLN